MKCNNCNFELSSDALFCPSCGSSVANSTNGASSRKTCPHCQASLPLSAKFCKSCGKSITEQQKKVCTVCGSELNSDSSFCPVCGTGTSNANYPNYPKSSNSYVPAVPAKSSKKWLVVLLLVFVVAVTGGIFAWLYISSNNTSEDNTLPANTSTPASTEKAQKKHEQASDDEPIASHSDTEAVQTSDFLFPSDTYYITASDLYGYSQEQVALIRNEIYARHGYIFQTEPYKSYFSSKEWYSPNPYFNESVFNIIEKTNKDFIVEYEKSMGWR